MSGICPFRSCTAASLGLLFVALHCGTLVSAQESTQLESAPAGESAAWKPLPDAPVVDVRDPHRERNRVITDDLIAAIEEDRRPDFSVHDGRASWEMTQAVFDACVQGRRVALPLDDRSHPLTRWA